jgi:hypothetical protein
LRSVKQTMAWLLDDMRMDAELLMGLNLEEMGSWIDDAPKKESLKMLIKTLREL